MYNSYEEYMRDVLGYPYNRSDIMQGTHNNAYTNTYNNFQNQTIEATVNEQELQDCYPEIYNIVKPMVKSTCQMYAGRTITKELVEEMTLKIYNSVETDENRNTQSERKLKNGDVINPNAKQENRSRANNYLLNDLIKIMLLNELSRPGGRPPMPPKTGPVPPPPLRPPVGPNRPPYRPF